jgi:hypothetical protein
MSNRRTHSSIDALPAPLRETLTSMIVDGDWPSNFPASHEGKPTYDDLVAYCAHCGHKVARSSIGRWARHLRFYERMREARDLACSITKEMTDENAPLSMKASAEIVNAHVLDLASRDELSAKDIGILSGSIRDLTNAMINADKYIREQIAAKVKTTIDKVSTEIKDIDAVVRKKVQAALDELLMGVKKS